MSENTYCVTMAHMMQPQHANPAGNVHGGVIMKFIDDAAGVIATRHARTNAVTAAIERLDFHRPVFIGNLLILKASLNVTGRCSMEIGVRVEAEDLLSGENRHIASAYLTFVSLDKDGRPLPVQAYTPSTEVEMRRAREAANRKQCYIQNQQAKETIHEQ